jgi:hypothetical protein
MLLEAKEQMSHGDFLPWAVRTFSRDVSTLRRYMKLVQIIKTRPRARFESVRQAVRPDHQGSKGVPQGAAWTEPVRRVVAVTEARTTR